MINSIAVLLNLSFCTTIVQVSLKQACSHSLKNRPKSKKKSIVAVEFNGTKDNCMTPLVVMKSNYSLQITEL